MVDQPLVVTNFSKIQINDFFDVDGEKYKKTSQLTFNDMVGLEHYIDPLFDRKIGAPPAPPVKGIDTSAKVVKDPTLVSMEDGVKPVKAKKARKGK